MLYNFNSIKVRLKPCAICARPGASMYFNSIKVRLKPYIDYATKNHKVISIP